MKKLQILAYIITVLSFFFLLRFFFTLNLKDLKLPDPLWAIVYLLLFIFLYSLTIFCFSFSWKLILEFLSQEKLSYTNVIEVYTKANLAKYIPGKVVYLAVRNLLGNRYGWKQSIILMSNVLEIFFLFLTTCLVSLVLTHKDFIDVILLIYKKIKGKFIFSFIIIIFMFILGGVLYLLIKKRDYIRELKKILTWDFLILSIKIFIINSIAFFISGLILFLIYSFVMGIHVENSQIIKIITSYILSWMGGFVNPGAPGGIGIRETILILLLASTCGSSTTLMAVLLHRLVSVTGDLLALGLGYLIKKVLCYEK